VTLVSPEDAHHLQGGNWYAVEVRRNWKCVVYARRCYKKGEKPTPLHRAILGEPPNYIDHKDHDGLNNRRGNLRPCTRSQNYGNGRYRLGPSGYRGVREQRKTGARAYDAAALARFGEFATLNFPHCSPPVPAGERAP
jgi:hypothetical protein